MKIPAMDVKVEQKQPLLQNKAAGETVQEEQQTNPEYASQTKQPKTPKQKLMRKTFKGTAILSKLLPTGSALTFQLLSPVSTNRGQCKTHVSQYLTLGLVASCASLCFFLSFTDSFRDDRGKVRYGVATFKGLWVMDGPVKLSAEEAYKYRLKFIDFVHALVSIMIFTSLALFDQNVVKCFYPTPSEETKELLMLLPACIGAIGSLLFVSFPTKRNGIGCPLSKN
ncbi:protein DMP7-like [Durio zibethinus]|uniref:Protein DMP7-like n=1 Tax=Durio zibethinus TaxID=66656 RepID=A0A6P6ABA3_DURZI|nr:protein DMP7-like [Durio zibethinus]